MEQRCRKGAWAHRMARDRRAACRSRSGFKAEWPTVRQICRVIRSRQVKKNAEWQKPQHEVVYLVSSLPAAASPQALLGVNRDHWRIEIMHRNKDVILGEDGYTNRCDNAPRNIFSLTGFVLKILKSVAPSPTRAIEHFGRQKPRNPAVLRFLLNHPGRSAECLDSQATCPYNLPALPHIASLRGRRPGSSVGRARD